LDKLPQHFQDLTTRLCCQIWTHHKLTAGFFEKAVREVYSQAKFGPDIVPPMRAMVRSWADILESSSPLPNSVLDVFTILRITLAGFDRKIQRNMEESGADREALHRQIFYSLSAKSAMYNIDGVICDRVSDSYLAIQTRFCRVVAPVSTVYGHCKNLHDGGSVPVQPLPHWTSCEHAGSELLGLKVALHLHGQVALQVWAPASEETEEDGGATWDPPETGILLPLSAQFVTKSQEFASDYFKLREKGQLLSDDVDHSKLYLTSWIEWICNQMDEELSLSWPGDYEEMRQLFVLNRLGLLSSQGYQARLKRLLEPYFSELQSCYGHEYLEAMDAYLEEDTKTSKMISFYYLCESKEGHEEALGQLCRKFKIPEEWRDMLHDEESLDERESWDEAMHPAGPPREDLPATQVRFTCLSNSKILVYCIYTELH
jgi:hypothetical protein